MSFINEVFDTFRDHTRDDICVGLQRLGIDVEMCARGRDEERIGGSGSLGVIDIPKGPIRWINVRKVTHGGVGGTYAPTDYHTEYGVPDPRLGSNSPEPRIKSVRKKAFPLLSPVVGLHWNGRDFGLGIISRLNSDFQLKHSIMRSRDVRIRAYGDHRCWIMSTKTRKIPSEDLWSCYQAIAQHLLAEWTATG